ncbi:NAD(P)/FAD-dependent oxidoreductase [Falsihalocynthiibacter sp. BN13B15]|uniref:NAD(P)/FAD-dependent oxidoreductase n=1 Tax=Falsihalocynthiibacter sp. BN13B15 TaxID=3240871 RepID=UPI00350F28C4
MKLDIHELIVVGSGPAGSMAAFHAAKMGINVTILDRASFPRAKPCAGGLTAKTLARLPYPINEIVQHVSDEINLTLRLGENVTVSAAGLICAFVVRQDLDQLLLEGAKKAGAQYRQINSIEQLSVNLSSVCLTINQNEKLSAKYLIAADGANSQIRRMAKPNGSFSRGFAVEGTVDRSLLSTMPEMELNFGYVEFGYGWLFPKGDHVNVGLFTNRQDIRLGKDMLRAYSYAKLGTDKVRGIVGFPLGFGGKSYRQNQERILFAGDAAGMAEPLLGEGIHNAIMSGELAGVAVANALRLGQPAKNSYHASLRPIRRDLVRTELVSKIFYENLDRGGYSMLKTRAISSGLIKGFAAGKTLNEVTNKFAAMFWQKPLFTKSILKSELP